MTQSNPNNDQTIDQLRARYETLNTKKITAQANLQTSSDTLETLKRQARETYETDDLTALRAKLAEMIANNERMRAEYQAHLESIENKLAEVETQHTAATTNEPRI